jgi:hypothetical protein
VGSVFQDWDQLVDEVGVGGCKNDLDTTGSAAGDEMSARGDTGRASFTLGTADA